MLAESLRRWTNIMKVTLRQCHVYTGIINDNTSGHYTPLAGEES